MSALLHLHPPQVPEKIGFEQLREALLKLCATPMGAELIEALHPSAEYDTVRRWLLETDEFMRMHLIEGQLPIEKMPDIRDALKLARVVGRALDAQSHFQILIACEYTRRLRQFFQSRKDQFPHTAVHALRIEALTELEKAIRTVIDENAQVKDSASRALREVRSKLNRARGHLRNSLQRALKTAQSSDMASDEGITLRNGRMVIPIRAEYKRRIQGFVHDVSATGQTVYIEPAETLQLNNEVRELESAEAREIERILRELTDVVRSFRGVLQQNSEAYAHLDATAAKARLGIKMKAFIAQLSHDRSVNIQQGRNPNLLLRFKQPEEVVPLNLNMPEDERCLIITGPNAGGKSVAMKTIGLFCMMTQSGLAIPAQEGAKLPLLDALFVDLGDEQSVDNDLSTFSSRLKWMKETWDACTPDSLVMIDEAGTGTDPEEGSALYQSFLSYLTQKKTLSLVTTHHGRLKVFAHDFPGVVNGSMEFDQEHLEPTYRFLKGIPGSSYAFDIAQRMGVSPMIIQEAQYLVGEKKQNLESLILALEQEKQFARKARLEAEKIRLDAESQIQAFEEKKRSIMGNRENIIKQANQDARRILEQANAIIEQEVQKIRTSNAEKEIIKEARASIQLAQEKLTQKAKKLEPQKPKKPGEIAQVGDWVRLMDNALQGELIELKGKLAVVQTETITVRTKPENLEKAQRPQSKKKLESKSNYAEIMQNLKVFTNRLDLRGMRGDAALAELTPFLDRAKVSGWNQIEVIHGKGHGILQEVVHEYLKGRSDVKRFELAPEDQGGSGCTLVEF